jgi:hypothetical protein
VCWLLSVLPDLNHLDSFLLHFFFNLTFSLVYPISLLAFGLLVLMVWLATAALIWRLRS